MADSSKAISKMVADESLWRKAEGGGFVGSQEDSISMLYVFHSAYKANIVAQKRNGLIADINHQSGHIKEATWKS